MFSKYLFGLLSGKYVYYNVNHFQTAEKLHFKSQTQIYYLEDIFAVTLWSNIQLFLSFKTGCGKEGL